MGSAHEFIQKIALVAIGKGIDAVNIDRVAYLVPGTEYLRGTAVSPGVFDVLVRGTVDTARITNSKIAWLSGKLKVVDADHLTIEDRVTFVRVAALDRDPPCDPRGPSRVFGNDAFARGRIYGEILNDPRTAACWYGVGAEQGNAEAQNHYGTLLFDGSAGLAKDPVKAFAWFQKSAMQGNVAAATNLSREFGSGAVVPRSEQRSAYWAARATLNDLDWYHQQVFLPVPSWAADSAGQCDPRNPPRILTGQIDSSIDNYPADGRPRIFRGSAQALAQGRVAYEARALETARCWFEVAANNQVIDMLPTVADVRERAYVYLGILYAFGLGGPKDPPRGFEYIKKAADAGDKFGMMYLANFYRYGIGTRADMNAASSLIARIVRSTEGIDAYMRVQGTHMTDAAAIGKAISGFTAIVDDTTCKEELSGGVRYLKDCVDHADNWLAAQFGRPARHTIDHPEEIWPEHFDAAIPFDIRMERMYEGPVNRKGVKIP
jgi:TPR repeat protein